MNRLLLILMLTLLFGSVAHAALAVGAFHFSSFSQRGDSRGVGGSVEIPSEIDSERVSVTLEVPGRVVARWFGTRGAAKIQFEFELGLKEWQDAVITASNRPLHARSKRDLSRPSVFFQKFQLKNLRFDSINR